MKIFLTVVTWLLSLVLVAVVAGFIVLFAAGPHAGLLPKPLEVVVAVLCWAAVVLLPLQAARMVWRRLSRNTAG